MGYNSLDLPRGPGRGTRRRLPNARGRLWPKKGFEATVQCKFCGKADLRLRATDVDAELATVRELVAAGRAKTYYFITSQGVDAPVAAKVRDKLFEAGVSEPHLLGREWLTQQIGSSARLRALVPRVYGLGDLSTILDQRCAH